MLLSINYLNSIPLYAINYPSTVEVVSRFESINMQVRIFKEEINQKYRLPQKVGLNQ